jgi:predicted transcriptional regulator
MGKAEFTDRELDLMSVLWRLGSGTVSEVREALGEEVGYTSVLKMLQILEEKGHVRHEDEGRAYRYIPTVKSEDAGRTALGRIVNKIFQGSAELTLARLVEERPISPKELERMRRILDELAEGGRKGGSTPKEAGEKKRRKER